MRSKKKKGLSGLRQRYAYSFVGPWILGLAVFFIMPVIASIKYSFADISVTANGFVTEFAGFKNYSYIIKDDPTYLDQIRDAVASMLYSLPMVIALSLVLAVLLNQRFFGRTVFRAIYFLPIIIASSVIVKLLSDPSINAPVFNLSTDGEGIMDYNAILGNLNLPGGLTSFLTFFLSNAVSLTWDCGVQTILFLAGLQGIPDSLYEVSKIEGANKWEEFWQITIPMLRHVLSLVIIYTMIANFTSADNPIMTTAISLIRKNDYAIASATLWFYFIIVISVVGLLIFLYNKLCIKKWE